MVYGLFVSDLYEEGHLVQFDRWMERGANWNDFLTWRGILTCLPNIWKEFLTLNHEHVNIQTTYGVLYNENVKSVGNLCQKTVKNILRNSKFEQVEIKSKEN